MEKTKLTELGLTESQVEAVMKLSAEDEINVQKQQEKAKEKAIRDATSELSAQLSAQKSEYEEKLSSQKSEFDEKLSAQVKDFEMQKFISGIKFTSKSAAQAALQKLRDANPDFTDGVLSGTDEFLEKLKAEDPEAFAAEGNAKLVTGGGNSGGGGETSGVEAAFFGMNPGLSSQ